MFNESKIIEKEIDILYQKYFNARSGVVKYLQFYISFCGLVATLSSLVIKTKPELSIHILPLIVFGIIFGLIVLNSAIEGTAIVIWSLYRINLIKKEEIKLNLKLCNYIKLDNISLYNSLYMSLMRRGNVKFANFIKPFCYKNYREHIIIFINCLLLLMLLYIYQFAVYGVVNIYLITFSVILFSCLQVRLYSSKFDKWDEIIISVQTKIF